MKAGSRTSWRSLTVIGATAGFLGIQMWHTVTDRNRWPFCSYNMFSYRLGSSATQLRVLLVTDAGYTHGPDDPWGLLPMESFRIDSILRRVFCGDASNVTRDKFCEHVLARLNGAAWRKWDEIRGSFRRPEGHRFVAMVIYLVKVDFRRNDPNDRSDVVEASCLHRFDPGGVLEMIEGIPGRYPA